MYNRIYHVAIAHKSHVVFHGLSAILKQARINFEAKHLQTFDELQTHLATHKVRVVFISPHFFFNIEEKFKLLKNAYNPVWIGILHESGSRNTQQWFDKIIYFDDSEEFICRTFEESLTTNETPEIHEQPGRASLSDRELDVLRLLVQGLSSKEIADKLFISIHTVITHRKNITQKTGIKSVSGLTIYAVVNKLVSLE